MMISDTAWRELALSVEGRDSSCRGESSANHDIHLSSGPATALADTGCPRAGPAEPGPRQAHPQVMSVVRRPIRFD